MNVEQQIRLSCLKLAIDKQRYTGDYTEDSVSIARQFYSFLIEEKGGNVLDATPFLQGRAK